MAGPLPPRSGRGSTRICRDVSFVVIYHIAAEADWRGRTDVYAPGGWRAEGFVHCSTEEQVVRVANRFFAGRRDLVLLHIDPSHLSGLVVWERPLKSENPGFRIPCCPVCVPAGCVVPDTIVSSTRP